jgi:hypothetical protein
MDLALDEMFGIVKQGITQKGFNPYYQAQRDKYAVEENLFQSIDSDIVMVLDKIGEVIAFQLCDGLAKLLGENLPQEIVEAFDTFSTLQPVPLPDGTRHGLHWVEFLKEKAHLDFRNPENDLRNAKSGVYHFGCHFRTGDPHGARPMTKKQDSGKRLEGASSHVLKQVDKLANSAFGACTEALSFLFKLLDSTLFAEYESVAHELEKSEHSGTTFRTRRSVDIFSIIAFLVNLKTTEHKDESDWKFGFAGLVPVGEYTGGDLLLRELGLRIRAPPGCLQLIRGRELRHSIADWEGRRFVVVAVTHDSVRQWANTNGGVEVHELSDNSGESEEQEQADAEVKAKKRKTLG